MLQVVCSLWRLQWNFLSLFPLPWPTKFTCLCHWGVKGAVNFTESSSRCFDLNSSRGLRGFYLLSHWEGFDVKQMEECWQKINMQCSFAVSCNHVSLFQQTVCSVESLLTWQLSKLWDAVKHQKTWINGPRVQNMNIQDGWHVASLFNSKSINLIWWNWTIKMKEIK